MKVSWVGLIFSVLVILNAEYCKAQPEDLDQDAGSSVNAGTNAAFEGSIHFVQETASDTSFYTYHVKGKMVRMEVHSNCDGCEEEENRLIFDIEEGTIKALHPSRKLYMNLNVRPYVEIPDSSYLIKQTKNNKKILGYKCYQWRVKNLKQNTEIAYWVVDGNFNFFDDFLRLWNRAEKHASYFLKIPDTDGYFPILSVERTNLRDEKMRLHVTSINPAVLEDDIFEVPSDYMPYDH